MGYLQENAVISIVDDDESVRVATKRLLRLHGFVVHTFACAAEFLQSPIVNDTNCLIADVRMPGMNGIELQEHLVQQGHRTPVIFITAFPEERHRTRAVEAGAISFLRKPFDARTLIDCIDEALRRRGN
jgi:FixJ family two-component response regulator